MVEGCWGGCPGLLTRSGLGGTRDRNPRVNGGDPGRAPSSEALDIAKPSGNCLPGLQKSLWRSAYLCQGHQGCLVRSRASAKTVEISTQPLDLLPK